MFVAMCVIQDGRHVYAGPECPHGRTEDELGPIAPAGWTVQSANHNHEEPIHGC